VYLCLYVRMPVCVYVCVAEMPVAQVTERWGPVPPACARAPLAELLGVPALEQALRAAVYEEMHGTLVAAAPQVPSVPLPTTTTTTSTTASTGAAASTTGAAARPPAAEAVLAERPLRAWIDEQLRAACSVAETDLDKVCACIHAPPPPRMCLSLCALVYVCVSRFLPLCVC
jgi:hypothetical protein